MKTAGWIGAWQSFGLAMSFVFSALLPQAVHAAPEITDDIRLLAQRLREDAGPARRPFAIVDKRAALLVVFHADGNIAGSSAALLGRDLGDHSVPGVGERTQRQALRPGDATTPAGRFLAQPGRNHTGEAVLWLDMDAALAIHRLRPGRDHGARSRRLVGADPRDRRFSAGCVVVGTAFFTRVVLPVLGQQPAMVYVLPEAGLQGQP